MTKRIVLAVDQSLHSTGFALYVSDEGSDIPTYETHGVLKVPARVTGLDAIERTCVGVYALLDEFTPDVFALEYLHFPGQGRTNPDTIIKLGILAGRLWEMGSLMANHCLFVTSPEVASYLGVAHNATRKTRKARSRFWATAEIHGQVYAGDMENDLIPEDAADAMVIAQVAINRAIELTYW